MSAVYRSATVVGVTDAGCGLRSIDLEGRSLAGVRWTPGAKVQLRIEGFTNRTYTPVCWDRDRGATTVVATTHGSGPGAARIAGLMADDSVQIFGPRASIDLTDIESPLLVGDETCFGLALAWRNGIGRPAAFCFEVQDPDAATSALSAIGLTDMRIVRVEPATSAPLVAAVLAYLDEAPSTHLVIAGRAQSIRHLRTAIRDARAHSGNVTVKAYWDENRPGLD